MVRIPARLAVRLVRVAARCHRALPPPTFLGLPSGRAGRPFFVVVDGVEVLSIRNGEPARARSATQAWQAAELHLKDKGEIT